MTTLADVEAAADALSAEQKQELISFLATRLRPGISHRDSSSTSSTAATEINKTPGVCGGAACVRDTRIPVWTLVQLKKLGRTETQLVDDFPSITQIDLDAVWNYYREHPNEIDQAIEAEELED
jgi:uncharacterized protein (DUF433 family)